MSEWYSDNELIEKVKNDGYNMDEDEFLELVDCNPNKNEWIELSNEFFARFNIPYAVLDATEGEDEFYWLVDVNEEA